MITPTKRKRLFIHRRPKAISMYERALLEISHIRTGANISKRIIIEQWGVSPATAKRDMQLLRHYGLLPRAAP